MALAELLAPEDLPLWVPGKILAQSDDLGWQGIGSRTYAYKGQDVEVPAMRDFMLVSYRIGVTPMQRRFGGKWSKTTCGPGAVSLLTRSQTSHWHWTEDVDVTHVYLTQAFVAEIASEVTGQLVESVTLADVLRTDDPLMTTAMNAIAAEAQENGLGGPLYVDSIARQLVIHLLRRYATVTIREAETSRQLSPQQQSRLLDFIEANLQDAITLEAMAAVVNLGACTFARRFKRSFGVAPYAYVLKCRLERAQRLLAKTIMPAKQVASACGFADQAHLTRLFSRCYNTTPAAYRRSLDVTDVHGQARAFDCPDPVKPETLVDDLPS